MIEKLVVTAYNINMKRLYNLEQDAKRKEYDNLSTFDYKMRIFISRRKL